jgi:hypothetical protein
MVKITDKSNYRRFAGPASEDEGIWLDHVEVHLVTHPIGQIKPMHTHTRGDSAWLRGPRRRARARRVYRLARATEAES